MTEWIAVDVAALHATRPRFDDLADAVAAIVARLGADLDAEGPCWGADEAGRAFASQYLPASTALRSLAIGTSEGIVDLGAAVGRVADGFAAADSQANGTRWGD